MFDKWKKQLDGTFEASKPDPIRISLQIWGLSGNRKSSFLYSMCDICTKPDYITELSINNPLRNYRPRLSKNLRKMIVEGYLTQGPVVLLIHCDNDMKLTQNSHLYTDYENAGKLIVECVYDKDPEIQLNNFYKVINDVITANNDKNHPYHGVIKTICIDDEPALYNAMVANNKKKLPADPRGTIKWNGDANIEFGKLLVNILPVTKCNFILAAKRKPAAIEGFSKGEMLYGSYDPRGYRDTPHSIDASIYVANIGGTPLMHFTQRSCFVPIGYNNGSENQMEPKYPLLPIHPVNFYHLIQRNLYARAKWYPEKVLYGPEDPMYNDYRL